MVSLGHAVVIAIDLLGSNSKDIAVISHFLERESLITKKVILLLFVYLHFLLM